MSKPQRIRSRIMILIYHNVNSSNLILEHLKNSFKINDDKKWLYIIRQELIISGQINTIVFIELNFSPDLYTNRLDVYFNEDKISPSIHCWPDKEFLLRYILTFSETTDIESSILTNFNLFEIKEKAVILRKSSHLEDLTQEHTKIQPELMPLVQTDEVSVEDRKLEIEEKLEDKKLKNEKTVMQSKQIERFNSFYSKFNEIIESSEPKTNKALTELERYLRNMINYRSSYIISQEMQNNIKSCQVKLKDFKKNL